jgi:hypothetical protein
MFLAENSAEELDRDGQPLIGPDTLNILFNNGFEDYESISMITQD